MSDEIKRCAESAAKVLNSIPVGKWEMAARLAETYAAGLAALCMELAEADKPKDKEGA